MSLFLTIVMVVLGIVWALLGIANIVALPSWGRAGEEGVLAIALTVNVAFFIIPGLVLCGLGYLLDKKLDEKDKAK